MYSSPLFAIRFRLKHLFGLVDFIAILVLWQLASVSGLVNAILLPSPVDVATSFIQLALSGGLLRHLSASFLRIVAGFVVSLAIALPLGIAVAVSPTLNHLFSPVLSVSKYLPVVAFIPLMILWFGIGDTSKVLLLVLGVAPYLTALTIAALERVPEQIVDIAYTMGLSKFQLVKDVLIPYAMPQIVEAMRVSVAIAWTYLTVAELIASSSGLGYLIVQSQRYLQTDTIFVGILLISAVGLLTDHLFVLFREKVFTWEEGLLREKKNRW